jgi:hypothetical protein
MESMRGLPLAPLISRGKKPMERGATRARLRTLARGITPYEFPPVMGIDGLA